LGLKKTVRCPALKERDQGYLDFGDGYAQTVYSLGEVEA